MGLGLTTAHTPEDGLDTTLTWTLGQAEVLHWGISEAESVLSVDHGIQVMGKNGRTST